MNSTILNSYSGIKTHQFGLDSVSNNIANVNTTGYRESRPEFETLFAPKAINSSTPSGKEINLGVTASSNAISTKSGSYRASDGEFDLAYQGRGWFVVGENKEGEMEVKKDGFTQKQQNYFTRDGNFGKDAEGYLVNSKGYYVYGVNLGKIKEGFFVSNPKDDEKNLASEKLSPLQIPQNLRFKPLQTSEVNLAINLNKNENPINAYPAFSKEGKIDEDKLFSSDANIFFAQDKPLDPSLNNKAQITLTDNEGKEKTFVFTYGKDQVNGFTTLGELKTLIKNQTGLELTANPSDENNPSILLKLTNPSLNSEKIQTSGSFFDALGMSGLQDAINPEVTPYNPTHSYVPNDLVSYLGITFRKIGEQGNQNPLSDPNAWEILDTQKVPNYNEKQNYQAGEVVQRDGGIYLMDKNNQFLKIGEAKKFAFPSYNPQEQYGKNTLVQYQGKIYQRTGVTGNSDPIQDPDSWKEISSNAITSKALENAHSTSSVDIYDSTGKKYRLISEYNLVGGYDPISQINQKWEVTSYIQDASSGQKIGDEVKHSLEFDKNDQPIAPKVELDFKGEKLAYNILGTEDKKSSDELYTPSQISQAEQNGNPEGLLEHINVDANGVIYLKFSNGKQEAMGRVGIVAFSNDQGLSKMGGNLFGLNQTLINGETRLKSGNPILGWNEKGSLTMGNVKQGYLETSNVDVGNALTELILMQRGYSMNAKSFTTGDEMIKEAINLKK